ncbi:MAG: FecR domain-containing protein [Candidatus Pseudobacter hemicellulosilyticus]|uniref:FecR domain-containing protein n=1 Tax=Candidatus Pseudobacter hemicellulosilyticus TaxID=3121375 RepID=A0AAJ6BGW1_9BACT|nr:MAG: FecR domain-containing protein [Pseudobacter sp.]
MTISPTLVDAFLKGNCTDEEAGFLLTYFREHPEALEQYIGEQDWQSFHPEQPMGEKLSGEVWALLQQQLGHTAAPAPVRRLSIRRYAVAATILAAACTLVAWLFRSHEPAPAMGSSLQQLAADTRRQVENNSDTTMQVQLPDGSTAMLEKQSRLWYEPAFTATARQLTLEGKASFAVAKEKGRPFTVLADGIATTALGTRFHISNDASSRTVTVKLLEGKVVLRTADSSLRFKEVFLQPGQLYKVDRIKGTASLQSFPQPAATEKHKGIDNKKNSVQPASDTATWKYYKEPVASLFNRLSKVHQVTIEYRPEDVQHIFFTGQLMPDDPVTISLKAICLANDLVFEQTADGTVIISKMQR